MDAPYYTLHPETAAADGIRTGGYFEGTGAKALRYMIFRTESEKPRGTVVIVQGRNESIEKYGETIGDLNTAGFTVATFDLRGQALSGRLTPHPRAGHVHRFQDYVNDLERFLTQVVEPVAPHPLFLLAHSLGGLITLALAPELRGRVERIVLSAPLVGLTGLPLPKPLVLSMAALMRFTGFGGRMMGHDRTPMTFEGNPLTSCSVRFGNLKALREAHPEIGIGPPTARWLYEINRAMAANTQEAHLTRITVPTLILAPARDGVVPFTAQEALARRFRAARLIPIPGARHELLLEKDRYRAQATAACLAFFNTGTGTDSAEEPQDSAAPETDPD